MITVPIFPLYSFRQISVYERKKKRLKSGASDPSEIIFDGVLAIKKHIIY